LLDTCSILARLAMMSRKTVALCAVALVCGAIAAPVANVNPDAIVAEEAVQAAAAFPSHGDSVPAPALSLVGMRTAMKGLSPNAGNLKRKISRGRRSRIQKATALTCPEGTEQVGDINADIPGCGLQGCGERYAIDTIEDCQSACAANSDCVAFTWAPIGGDRNHMDQSACTQYDSAVPTSTWGPNQIFCKPSWHLSAGATTSCDTGTQATQAECEAAVASLAADAGTTPGRALLVGSGGSCGDGGWGGVPSGCVAQSLRGGDWAAHFKTSGPNCNNGYYQVVCSGPAPPPPVWHLSAGATTSCDTGTQATQAECEAAVASLAADAGTTPGRAGVQVGSGGSCGDGGWGGVPSGCVAQSLRGGDWAAHFKTSGPNCNNGYYQVVCSGTGT